MALACVVVGFAASCSSGTSKPTLPVGRATATTTSCSSAGGGTTLTGKVTNPLPNNGEVILIVGRFTPTSGPVVDVSSEVQLGPNRVAIFTIQALHVPNSTCSVAQTHVDLVLLPGVPYDPQNSGTLTGSGHYLPTPTSLVGQPLGS